MQQFSLHFILVALYFLGHAIDPTRVHMPSLIRNKQHVLQLYPPAQQLLIVQKQQSLDLELILYELDHLGSLVPLIHELYGQVVPEEVIFFEFAEDFILVDELIEGSHLSVPYHAVLTDRDIVRPLFLLITHLKLVNANDFHVEELLTL